MAVERASPIGPAIGARLGRWIFGHPVVPKDGAATESRLDLAEPLPLYVIHLTARPEGGEIRFQKDVHGRDLAGPAHWASGRAGSPELP